MPRETVAIVLFLGASFGLLWGLLSLTFAIDSHALGVLVLPLWLTIAIVTRVPLDPVATGAAVSAGLGVALATAGLLIARVRGV